MFGAAHACFVSWQEALLAAAVSYASHSVQLAQTVNAIIAAALSTSYFARLRQQKMDPSFASLYLTCKGTVLYAVNQSLRVLYAEAYCYSLSDSSRQAVTVAAAVAAAAVAAAAVAAAVVHRK
eukprot:18898-Heterococcus_DN1.PRE.5